jgi:hypothetical protein
MDIKAFVKHIDGFEYPARELRQFEQLAGDNDLLFSYGMSDDLLEIRGIRCDEFDAYDGTEVMLSLSIKLQAIWSPTDKPGTSWQIKINCEHETFRIMEDGDVFCYGIVAHKDQIFAAKLIDKDKIKLYQKALTALVDSNSNWLNGVSGADGALISGLLNEAQANPTK